MSVIGVDKGVGKAKNDYKRKGNEPRCSRVNTMQVSRGVTLSDWIAE